MKSYTAKKIVLESLPILLVVLILALIAGQILDTRLNEISPIFPFVLLIIPAFINITGDLAGVVGARVTSHLYTGELDEKFHPYSLLLANFVAILFVAFTAYIFLAICIIGLNYWVIPIFFALSPSSSPEYIAPIFFAILGAGVLATACTSLIGLLAARIVYWSGHDPDSIIPPLTTTVGDLLGILIITAALLAII